MLSIPQAGPSLLYPRMLLPPQLKRRLSDFFAPRENGCSIRPLVQRHPNDPAVFLATCLKRSGPRCCGGDDVEYKVSDPFRWPHIWKVIIPYGGSILSGADPIVEFVSFSFSPKSDGDGLLVYAERIRSCSRDECAR